MNGWFNYQATLKILIFSMLAGAALPALFALGVRLQSIGVGALGIRGAAPKRNRVLVVIAWLIYALVVAVVMLGVLFIARDFIAHHSGYHFLGARPK